MNANKELLLKNEVYQVVGCALEVLNELGHGLHEKPYENALVVEFGLRGAYRSCNSFITMCSSRKLRLLNTCRT
jgi:GxxExxY protein